MSTKKYTMPTTPEIARVDKAGSGQLNPGYHAFLGGIEDISGRVAEYVADVPTATQIRDALVAAGLMKSS